MMAGIETFTAVMAIFPVILVYLILQRYIIRGISLAGLKA